MGGGGGWGERRGEEGGQGCGGRVYHVNGARITITPLLGSRAKTVLAKQACCI